MSCPNLSCLSDTYFLLLLQAGCVGFLFRDAVRTKEQKHHIGNSVQCLDSAVCFCDTVVLAYYFTDRGGST